MAQLDLDAELAALPAMSGAELRRRWSDLTGKPVPKLSAAMLRLALAWELQAAVYGGLSKQLEQRLKSLTDPKDAGPPAPGTRLVREWNGALHTVLIGEDGAISWNGKTWNSLSEVARAITGTRWSGPAFFGLNKRKAAA